MELIFRALALITSVLGTIFVPRGQPIASAPRPRSLIKVSASRARVLCPVCQSENDDAFRFCQWCGSPVDNASSCSASPLSVDEDAIALRYSQFLAAYKAKASTRSRSATWTLFEKFLASRTTGARCVEDAQPKDVVEFLCWLDSCGARRRTAVHARHCWGRRAFLGALQKKGNVISGSLLTPFAPTISRSWPWFTRKSWE